MFTRFDHALFPTTDLHPHKVPDRPFRFKGRQALLSRKFTTQNLQNRRGQRSVIKIIKWMYTNSMLSLVTVNISSVTPGKMLQMPALPVVRLSAEKNMFYFKITLGIRPTFRVSTLIADKHGCHSTQSFLLDSDLFTRVICLIWLHV